MTEQEKVLDKVRKLFRLAEKNSNAEEAAAAMAKAQELLLRHKLDAAMLEEPAAEAVSDQHDPLEGLLSAAKHWRGRLAVILGQHNAVRMVTRHGALMAVGTASNVATVRYLYGYCTMEIERLMREWAARTGNRVGTTACNSFRQGAVDGVADSLNRMKAAVRQQYAGTQALVRVDQEQARLDAFMRSLNLSYGRRARMSVDQSARAAGRVAGSGISFNKQVEGGGRRVLALGQGR